jgi:hypothetical protein
MALDDTTFSLCNHCSDGPFDDILPMLVVVLILLPLLAGLKRLLLGGDELVVLHLGDDRE